MNRHADTCAAGRSRHRRLTPIAMPLTVVAGCAQRQAVPERGRVLAHHLPVRHETARRQHHSPACRDRRSPGVAAFQAFGPRCRRRAQRGHVQAGFGGVLGQHAGAPCRTHAGASARVAITTPVTRAVVVDHQFRSRRLRPHRHARGSRRRGEVAGTGPCRTCPCPWRGGRAGRVARRRGSRRPPRCRSSRGSACCSGTTSCRGTGCPRTARRAAASQSIMATLSSQNRRSVRSPTASPTSRRR